MHRLLILFLILIGSSLQAQLFPDLKGELLSEDSISLPDECKGKFTLIGMAYNQKAEEELRTWYEPSIDKFILKRGMFDSEYDVNIYFIPMFHGVTSLSYQNSFKRVKELTDKRLYSHVVFYKGDVKGYKEALELGDKEKPDFFLLDKNGRILKHFIGKFRETYFDEIIEIIDSEGL